MLQLSKEPPKLKSAKMKNIEILKSANKNKHWKHTLKHWKNTVPERTGGQFGYVLVTRFIVQDQRSTVFSIPPVNWVILHVCIMILFEKNH